MFCYMTTDEITFRKNGLSPSNTSWMILLIIIVWWILNVINKEKNKKHLFNFEKKYPSVSSFTIMISNFPKAELNINKNDNLTHFQELFNKLQFYKRSRFTYKVEKVNIAKSFNEISK